MPTRQGSIKAYHAPPPPPPHTHFPTTNLYFLKGLNIQNMNLKGSIGNFGVDYLFVLMNSGTFFYIKTKMSRMMNDTTFSMFWGVRKYDADVITCSAMQ